MINYRGFINNMKDLIQINDINILNGKNRNTYLEITKNNEILYQEKHIESGLLISSDIIWSGMSNSSNKLFESKEFGAISILFHLPFLVSSDYNRHHISRNNNIGTNYYFPLGSYVDPFGSWVIEIKSKVYNNNDYNNIENDNEESKLEYDLKNDDNVLLFINHIKQWLMTSELYFRDLCNSYFNDYIR